MPNPDPNYYFDDESDDERVDNLIDKTIKAANWLCILAGLAAGVYLLSGRVWR